MTSSQNLCTKHLVRRWIYQVEASPLFWSVRGHSMSIPSKPWLRLPDLDIGPSTHPNFHRGAAGSPLCRNVASSVTLGARHSDRKFCINSADTSCGPLKEGYPIPN